MLTTTAAPYRIERAGQTFAATVHGLDLREPLTEETVGTLTRDLAEHRVLVIPGQQLSHAQHVDVSRRFGPLDVYPVSKYVVPDHPEVLTISNIFKDGQPIGLYDGDEQIEWHTDYSWKARTSRASLLYSVVASETGGDTLFADSTAAYDELPEAVKQRIAGLQGVHSMHHLVETERLTNPHKAPLTAEERERMPDMAHPLVREHPETGRRSLLLGSMIISGIVGLGRAESDALLRELHDHATADRYVYRHQWREGDVVMWDNEATMHTRTPCDRLVSPRLLYRTTVLWD
ncbi:TauD/TfdA family dioxygenase (plasmid) [Streptomyces sp. NBC_00441]|uniref:TauD/TfdA dioxygenase family protein n=1 Tax=Streptomyces sp. NBC_00441 TaxID=2975742 RepID=UPI002E28C4F5|nr:TauD/TfdA family dioxygenase [Streptomyces sp. NBC_00441]